MASSDALAVATEAWDRWMAGDIEGFLESMAPDGVVTLPGTAPTSGVFEGRDAIGGWAQSLFELSSGTIDGRVETLADAGDGIVLASMAAKATRNDKTLDVRMLQRFEVVDGQIARLDHAMMDIDGWHSFWA